MDSWGFLGILGDSWGFFGLHRDSLEFFLDFFWDIFEFFDIFEIL